MRLEPLSPEIASLLASERIIVPQPGSIRRRAMLRARAAAHWQHGKAAGRWGWLPRIPPVAAAAGAGLVITALCAALVQATRQSREPAQAAASSRAAEPASAPAAPAIVAPEATSATVEPKATSNAGAVGSTRPASREEGYATELRLLQPARQAVSVGNFASALGSIAAHKRRFPKGRLAEEREALRVRALQGLGRADDARRAAAEFRDRYPRSVLSSQMGP